MTKGVFGKRKSAQRESGLVTQEIFEQPAGKARLITQSCLSNDTIVEWVYGKFRVPWEQSKASTTETAKQCPCRVDHASSKEELDKKDTGATRGTHPL